MFGYLDLLSEKDIPLTAINSADVLQFVLENKLYLLQHDKDMIAMLHEFDYYDRRATCYDQQFFNCKR